MRVGIILMILAVLVTGCQRQAAAPQAPPPTAQPSPAPTPVPTPPPAAPAGQSLLAYPGARQTNSSSYSAPGPTGTTAQWSAVTMETADPYEKVRDFYKSNPPSGYAQSSMNESVSDGNHEFLLWYARQDGKAWYSIAIKENKEEGKVEITVAAAQGQ